MELKVNRKQLINALCSVGQVASKNTTLPILENVKMSAREDGTLVLSAFDLEVSMVRKIKIADSFEHPYEFCANPKDLSNLLKTLREDEVVLNISDINCEVRHAKGCSTLPTFPASDFPTIEIENQSHKITLRASMLYEWLKKAVGFASSDRLHPILNGVYLYVDDNEIGVSASDGLFLFTDNTTLDEDDSCSLKVGATLITKAISPLTDMLSNEENVIVYFGEKALAFRTSNAMLTCLKPLGSYPNFKRLIAKKESPVRVTVDKSELADSVSRAILSARVDSCLLRLSIRDNILHIDSEDLGFSKKSQEECPCEVEGDGITIGVKGNSLLSCVGAIDSGEVIFEFSSPKASINIYDDQHPNKTVLLMPLVISS